jgi:regulator of replication initiation timing
MTVEEKLKEAQKKNRELNSKISDLVYENEMLIRENFKLKSEDKTKLRDAILDLIRG